MSLGRPRGPKCALGRLHTTRLGARDAARAGYHDTGVVVIFPDMLKDDFERQFVESIANREYGVNPSAGRGKEK
ncbi:hypothetical protein ABMY26_00735 (plasmid) [Azospirillum sp. HJ39]|uniref:hypothetical protein n=1 Tax=Azospirillum sp. HJ39 TaxID=3159496 RepID=UPI003557E547